jgi:hypothetical protein
MSLAAASIEWKTELSIAQEESGEAKPGLHLVFPGNLAERGLSLGMKTEIEAKTGDLLIKGALGLDSLPLRGEGAGLPEAWARRLGASLGASIRLAPGTGILGFGAESEGQDLKRSRISWSSR